MPLPQPRHVVFQGALGERIGLDVFISHNRFGHDAAVPRFALAILPLQAGKNRGKSKPQSP